MSIRIDCVNKTDRTDAHERTIRNLGGPNADRTRWKRSEDAAKEGIEGGNRIVNVERSVGRVVKVVVATRRGHRYLKTEAHGEQPDDLLALPSALNQDGARPIGRGPLAQWLLASHPRGLGRTVVLSPHIRAQLQWATGRPVMGTEPVVIAGDHHVDLLDWLPIIDNALESTTLSKIRLGGRFEPHLFTGAETLNLVRAQ
jgi:hypothetical protein